MDEESLPPEILRRANRRGNEFAWPLSDVPDVIVAARARGLATLGGQVQFRTPNAICELYWCCVDAEDRRQDEPWLDYVARSANEVTRKFRELVSGKDLVSEGILWSHLAELQAKGDALEAYLCFVLYFVSQSSYSHKPLGILPD